MLKILIPFTMLVFSLFFASKAFALDIERVDKYDITELTQVAALETNEGAIISINEIYDTSDFAADLLNRRMLELKSGELLQTINIEFFYAKTLLAGRAPKGDGGIAGGPFNQ